MIDSGATRQAFEPPEQLGRAALGATGQREKRLDLLVQQASALSELGRTLEQSLPRVGREWRARQRKQRARGLALVGQHQGRCAFSEIERTDGGGDLLVQLGRVE